jgi:hypothetical protein
VSAPIVFISYASENTDWVVNFKPWFGGRLGNAYVKDYQTGDNLPFGPLDEWLKTEIGAAGAVVMIVSKEYIAKKYTLKEWWQALCEFNRRRLVFVPIMIDADAKAWWAEQKQQGNLNELDSDYAYANFTDASGNALDINNVFGPITAVTRRIGEVARLIRYHLESQLPREALPGASVAKPMAVDEVSVREAAASAVKPAIVVLGHPSAVTNKAVAENARQLAADLKGINLEPTIWNDAWRAVPSARQGSTALTLTKTLFVQPLGPEEAGDHAASPGAVRKWLEAAVKADIPEGVGLTSYRVVLWLPSNLKDVAFEVALAGATPDENLVLRHDDPFGLATWLGGQVGRAARANVAVLELEDLADVADSRTLRAALHSGFYKIIEEEVSPAPERWLFSGEMLVEQLKALDTDRVIIAIHDLNTGTARKWREARRELEQKLSMVEKATRDAGRGDLKFFRSALLVAKSDTLPWVRYPSPSQFENWCLLPFVEKGNALEPKSTQASVFRTYLRDWVGDST